MERRREALQSFVDAAAVAFGEFARDEESQRSVGEIFAAFGPPGPQASAAGHRLPACAHLDKALGVEMPAASLGRLVDAFRELEPSLVWRRRSHDSTASANFEDGHANAMILGPGGHEEREDAWLGVSLLAPHVRYPDHDHSPEEVYLVLSDGAFRHGNGDWFTPGVGGSFYNEPGIKHAMRSSNTPLLAFWALRADEPIRTPR